MKMKLKENKGAANSIVVMLMVFILILICLLFYLVKNPLVKVVEKEVASTPLPANTQAVETPKTYTYEDIEGTYLYTVDNENIKLSCDYVLTLNEDGTFAYQIAPDAHKGYYGNYTINNSQIILNKIFEYSDVTIKTASGKITLKINENNTISDSNKYETSDITNFTLEKETVKDDFILKDVIDRAITNKAIETK